MHAAAKSAESVPQQKLQYHRNYSIFW